MNFLYRPYQLTDGSYVPVWRIYLTVGVWMSLLAIGTAVMVVVGIRIFTGGG